ncbi:hypothetical protein PFHG_03020 [Plasmodium falciparum HB3]|uniref:Uncharacterized protein n=4 Tax=Plasmodium falciparum TaxID=5833 RepID=A0A024X2G3_PLAFC|nr:hypothetical protein PFFVO_04385 [Plasmodium falciparum Vietnam Oak-Knoll (FVO)]ETW59255.1 hypothetical protein PFMC_04734 [Plasmodium falciparum CAMP/Malaysia]EUR65598.1 hypothetical protein PFBG_04803 [Plasmodium falciparum 7G8]KOB61271.1 hypothetical protein PFHG_03020 [Plasmodium falciparum HB3]
MVNPPFDINYFLSSCTNLEKSYEHLLKEKKLYELKLNQALISLQEINEKYEEERKNVSLRISEQTHKIIKNENIFEDVQRQNEELKEKIEEINKEKELEKQLMEDKIKILKIQKEKENEEYEKQMRILKNELLKLNSVIVELDLDISSKDKEINNLSSYLKSCKEKHDKVVLEYKEKINDLIKQNEEREKKNKEALENIRNINDNLALNNLRNKLKLLQEDYNDLEKEYLYLKKSLSKTSTKKHLITKRIQGKSICNNKISYKI